MNPVLSVAIPAHDEERSIGRCIESVSRSAARAGQPVEIVVALNRCTDRTREVAESLGANCTVEDRRSIAAVRDAAVRRGSADAIVTLDADSRMSTGTVARVLARVYDERFIGGGTFARPQRWSIGIAFSLLAVAPHVLRRRVSTGMFWFRREAFECIGGFDERLPSVEDLDFALRLKALGAERGKRYGTV